MMDYAELEAEKGIFENVEFEGKKFYEFIKQCEMRSDSFDG